MEKNSLIVSTKTAAFFYGKSIAAIHKWQELPHFPKQAKVGRNEIDLKLLNDWVIKHFYGKEEIANSMAEEKLKYQRARTRREELQTQELEGKLISLEEVTEDLVFVLGTLKQRLLSWVKRIPPKAKMKEEKQIMKILHEETWLILDELSKGLKRIPKREKPTSQNGISE